MIVRITAKDLAELYWRKMRHAAIAEVNLKLAMYKRCNAATIAYWLTVHSILEKKSNVLCERAKV